jgi:D-cysteine desulfhydrase
LPPQINLAKLPTPVQPLRRLSEKYGVELYVKRDDREYFVKAIGDICERAIADYYLDVDFNRQRDIGIIDGYVGLGYALSQTEELELICEVARTEGIFLDPVYTGKAFYGMIQELKRNPKCLGERIIFLHTGGIFGLFPEAAQIRPLL